MRHQLTILAPFFVCGLLLPIGGDAVAQVPATKPLRVMRGTPGPVGLSSAATLVVPQAVGNEQDPQDPKPLTPEEQKAKQAATKRLQEFKKLVFDRRPSSVLKAWAAPDLKPFDPVAEGGAEPGEASAEDEPSDGDAGRVSGGSEALSSSEIQALIDAEREREREELAAAREGEFRPEAKAPEKPEKPLTEAEIAVKTLQRELEMLQRDVTLGRWKAVAAFFGTLAEENRKDAYEHFLKTLLRHPNKPPSRLPANLQEKNRFTFEDAFVLAAMAPEGFADKQVALLAPIVQRAFDGGSVREEWVRLLEVELQKEDGARRVSERQAALLLSALGMDTELGTFLPSADEAEEQGDREALNLLARNALAKYAEEGRNQWLEVAWQVTQAALRKGEIDEEQKQEALRRAVELAPKVRSELGPEWLADSFTQRPERGMEILATIGGQVATGFQDKAQDASFRGAGLELQKTAVEALLETAPDLADRWRDTIELLAAGWVQEAIYSNQYSKTSSFGTYMNRDAFGNVYWTSRRMGGGGAVTAVEPEDLMKAQPGDGWAALLSSELLPHFLTVSAQLWLKVNEYEQAFPYIERLASINGRKAKELSDEFLRVWKRNNNPNQSNRGSNYLYVYGFDDRANSIPLTRAKQERNLAELAGYVERLRALPMEPVDPQLLTEAFVAAHSLAEVYKLDAIEQVFGDIGELDPVVLGQLIGRMRLNLATVWRVPAVQEASKTRRSQKEMMAEVARGYDVAVRLAEESLVTKGRHWALLTAVGALMHDRNNFQKEQAHDSQFSEVRRAAFELFAEAADHYASTCASMTLAEETDVVFTTWFYAALGASDLGAIDESMVVAENELPRIRAALESLPDGSRERMQSRFAKLLMSRMSSVKPDIKFRYLQHGFAVSGDHEQLGDARKIWQYYQDLIHEIRLDTVVDGSAQVGTEPFGVRIDIVHTDAVGRESNGFQKYATNQNSMRYSYNYGRPTENYRDKFHDQAIASLSENFEILSVTFNSEGMEPLLDEQDGWQRSPYAYLLLQARGPQVDRIPEVKLDLDFKDPTGFFIMPVVSSPVVIDAASAQERRPFEGLTVTQLLDERRVDEGKVTLEIKAKCEGLVPDLDAFLELEHPGFRVTGRDDQGAAVLAFAEDQDAIESERVWMLTMEPEGSGAPGSFHFGEPSIEGVTATFQRYDDADLETVPSAIALRRALRANNPWWAWLLLGLAAVAFVFWFLFAKGGGGDADDGQQRLSLPEHLTPFSVLALLQQIRGSKALPELQRAQLEADMHRIEASHFGRETDESVDLVGIARHWLQKAS